MTEELQPEATIPQKPQTGKKVRVAAISAVAGLGLLGGVLFLGGMASAQEPTPTTPSEEETAPDNSQRPKFDGECDQYDSGSSSGSGPGSSSSSYSSFRS